MDRKGCLALAQIVADGFVRRQREARAAGGSADAALAAARAQLERVEEDIARLSRGKHATAEALEELSALNTSATKLRAMVEGLTAHENDAFPRDCALVEDDKGLLSWGEIAARAGLSELALKRMCRTERAAAEALVSRLRDSEAAWERAVESVAAGRAALARAATDAAARVAATDALKAAEEELHFAALLTDSLRRRVLVSRRPALGPWDLLRRGIGVHHASLTPQ
jgi:hypothetical protein